MLQLALFAFEKIAISIAMRRNLRVFLFAHNVVVNCCHGQAEMNAVATRVPKGTNAILPKGARAKRCSFRPKLPCPLRDQLF